MIARLPSFSAKAGPLWPKHLSRQPGHPICWPACRRAGCLQRAYPSHATEQDDGTTELTVAGDREFESGLLQRRVTCEPEPGAAEIGSGENDVGGDDADADLSGTADGRFPALRQMLPRWN